MCHSDVISYVALVISGIAVAVTIWGNFYNAEKQRDLQKLNTKTLAYSKFLGKIELTLPEDDGKVLVDNSKIKELNKALSVLLIHAPDRVIQEINKKIFNNDKTKGILFGRKQVKKLQLILHNDIEGKIKSSGEDLMESDFPHLPFK